MQAEGLTEYASLRRLRVSTRGMKMTIYEALKSKLSREPLNSELKAEVKRIISEAHLELAEKGRLPHQRRR
jgi:hypothetical protein